MRVSKGSSSPRSASSSGASPPRWLSGFGEVGGQVVRHVFLGCVGRQLAGLGLGHAELVDGHLRDPQVLDRLLDLESSSA